MKKQERLTKTFSHHYDKLMPEDIQNLGQQHFPTFKKHWDAFGPFSKNLIKVFPLALLLLSVFLTVDLGSHQQNINSNAATGTTLNSVTVSSIAALKQALADDTVDEIIVANGTYHVSPASDQRSDSLWIGSAYAGRTRPVTVKAQTVGGVTFDGGGTTYFGCISFEEGAHDQAWDGFNCASGQATDTGIIVFGGYAGKVAPHHITLSNIHILSSCTAHNERNDHAVYFSEAIGGPHDITLQDFTVDGPNSGTTGPGLSSALHFYHSDATNSNAWNVTVKRLHVNGTYQPIILWDSTLKNITIDTADLAFPGSGTAVRYETTGSTNILIENVVSTGGFYSSLGTNPTGVTLINNQFNLLSMPKPTPTNAPSATITPTPTVKLTSTPTPTIKPTSTPTPSPKPTFTPTPTLKPTSTPTPTISNVTAAPTITLAPTNTPTPTPTLSTGQQKKCVKFFFFKFCY